MKLANWKTFLSAQWILAVIIVLAFGVRILGNTQTPPSPYWEEVALGYDAYSVLQTGADHQGNPWPIVAFPSFGDFKPSGYFYALLPSIAVFGVNTFAVRFPAVLAGTLTTLFVYLWARDLAQNTKRSQHIGLASALLWALQPWSAWLGRIGFEVNLATFFLISGSYLFWRGVQLFGTQKTKHFTRHFFLWTLPATLLLAASMYTYHGSRLLAPLFAVFIALWQLLQVPKKKMFSKNLITHWLTLVVFAVVLTTPILLASQSPIVQQRIAETSIFSSPEPVTLSNELRANSNNAWWARILFHRNFFWASKLFDHYASHFSLSFLFLLGDVNPRHSSQYLGLLYPWELITVGWGILTVWATSRSRFSLLVGLTALSPVAAMFTLATPHALRAFPLAVWLAIFSGWGLIASYDFLSQFCKKYAKRFSATKWVTPMLVLVYGSIIFMSTFALGFYYWHQYLVRYSNEWQYGYEEMITKMRLHQQPGENLYVSRTYGRPSMYVLFYEKVDPRIVQAESPNLPKDQRELLQFQEWTFFDGQKHETGLHAAPSNQAPENVEIIDTINNLAGEPIWTLYR